MVNHTQYGIFTDILITLLLAKNTDNTKYFQICSITILSVSLKFSFKLVNFPSSYVRKQNYSFFSDHRIIVKSLVTKAAIT